MKKIFKVLFLVGVVSVLSGFTFSPKNSQRQTYLVEQLRYANDDESIEAPDSSDIPTSSEIPTSIEETKPCKVIVDKTEHGSLAVDIEEGEIGEIVTVHAKHDLLYKIDSVSVNGIALIESETTSGLFQFALVEGANKLTAKFVVDEELCGSLTTIIQQAGEKDWTNLFTIENVVTIIKWLLDGGLLIAMVRYFIKDKKLADKVEKAAKDATTNAVPEATKQAVKTIITPMYNQIVSDSHVTHQLACSLVKCMVLMQQGTPEAKIAILDELEKVKNIVDPDLIANTKLFIEKKLQEYMDAYKESLQKLNEIGEHHEEILNDAKEEESKDSNPSETSETGDNGTTI